MTGQWRGTRPEAARQGRGLSRATRSYQSALRTRPPVQPAGGDLQVETSGVVARATPLAALSLRCSHCIWLLAFDLSPFPSRVAPHGQRPLWSVNRGSHRPGLRLHWHSLLSARVSHQAGFNHRKHCQTMGTPGRGESSKVQRAVPIWVGAAIAKHGRNQRTSAIGHESRRIASPSVRATRR